MPLAAGYRAAAPVTLPVTRSTNVTAGRTQAQADIAVRTRRRPRPSDLSRVVSIILVSAAAHSERENRYSHAALEKGDRQQYRHEERGP